MIAGQINLNTNSKPRTKEIDGIIIHSMAQYIDGKHAPDFLEGIGLSAHYFIEPDGLILYGVAPKRIAYHAGKSKLGEQENLNSTFVGIEILVEGSHSYKTFIEAIKNPGTFTERQYERTAEVCRDLINAFPAITLDRIVRHSDVSGEDIRKDPKVDPGSGFSMLKLKKLI